ncbi:ATP-grasp domain-containing protein [Salibacterium salarium]|uniref:ATP-grasp domain-containing protein n=1 Tax=Salibacterium salarium TaxID=284579 RepID=A0A3R9QQ44_9BACI|nr:ATP-grasp domain-containing protein [Salibacterium salarium]RSL35112.1 ATP-grasp domain-containing protein [Salibacterium salarium]
MKKILIVGAGYEQIDMISKAFDMGHYVIVADADPLAPGFEYASESHIISTTNKEELLKLASEKQIDAVSYMITETPMESVLYISKSLNLPGPSEESVKASQNKNEMRRMFEISEVPGPTFQLISEQDSIDYDKLTFPLVIKPSDKAGQIGLNRVYEPSQLSIAMEKAFKHSSKKEVVIEEYLEGQELNIVIFVQNNRIELLTISDRERHPTKSFGVALSHRFPSKYYSDALYHEIRSLCEKIIKSLNISNGIVYPQILLKDNCLYVIEVGERIPGGKMKEVFKLATGYDLVELQLKLSLNEEIDLEKINQFKVYKSVFIDFLTAKPGILDTGKVLKAEGIEEARNVPNVIEANYFVNPNEGLEIRPLNTASDRFFYVITAGDNINQVIEGNKESQNKISFVVDKSSEVNR